MAKSVRATSVKRNKGLRLKKMQPLLADQDRKRQIRLTSYTALQKVRAAEQKGEDAEEIDEETKVAAEHAKELERCDEQKRALRDAGHFFFVHPSVKKDEAFPVVSNPDGKVAPYKTDIPDSDKNVSFHSKDWRKINKLRKKTSRSKRGSGLQTKW